jgi:uncharacterized membrane protein
MHKGRFEAFTDAVIAIIMTVMVLELKPPAGSDLASLFRQDGRPLLLYLLSFVFLGIYWNNHHHMMQAAKHVNGAVLWANLHLLFWLSLFPFGTAWLGAGNQALATWPSAFYGVDLLLCAVAYYILSRTLVRANRDDPSFEQALGRDYKGRLSLLIYAVGIAFAFLSPLAACACYVTVAFIWVVPDPRFERR